MAKKKTKKENSIKRTSKSYIRKNARSLPIYQCYISPEWELAREASIAVVRKHTNGNFTIGIYLVDLLYEGLKESFYLFNIPEFEFDSNFA